MKKFVLVMAFLLLVPITTAFAHDDLEHYSPLDVAENNTSESCWVIFDEYVYDITDSLEFHEDKFMDISDWCGTDMTKAFQDKDGRDRDHKEGTYESLEESKIGELDREMDTFGPLEASQHDDADSCWVTFENGVYDITSSLNFHGEKFLEIEPWCGTDMTEAFQDKDGRDRDHKKGTYESLAKQRIGTLDREKAEYTASDISEHNTADDCWVSFEDGVYDITSSLEFHEDKFMDIEPWCGTDMTEAFQDKDGRDRDHKKGTYESLAEQRIGTLIEEPVEETYEFNDPYNFYVIFFGTIILYTISWGLSKWRRNEKFVLHPRNHKLIWNTVLVITLIPALLFGIIMSVKFSIPVIDSIDFNWLFWHVEGSIIFGTIALLHFLSRFAEYLMPAKLLLKRKTQSQDN